MIISCSDSKVDMLTQVWHMEGEVYTVEFRNDHTYVFREGRDSVTGNWQLNEKGDKLTLEESSSGTKVLAIEKLTNKKLELNDNGDRMSFNALHAIGEAQSNL